jgi:hypothetical protein
MARRKKQKSIQLDEKEVVMTETAVEETQEQALESVQNEIDLARVELERTKLEIEQKKHELMTMKITPSREHSAEEMKLVEKQVNMSHEKTTLSEKIERQRARDSMMVTGRFMNRRAPGQPVKLPYIKHNTDPVKWYPLEDGKVYTIPRGFADQLNGGSEDDPCYYTPKFTQKAGDMNPDAPESAIHSVDTSNKKYAFVALNY